MDPLAPQFWEMVQKKLEEHTFPWYPKWYRPETQIRLTLYDYIELNAKTWFGYCFFEFRSGSKKKGVQIPFLVQQILQPHSFANTERSLILNSEGKTYLLEEAEFSNAKNYFFPSLLNHYLRPETNKAISVPELDHFTHLKGSSQKIFIYQRLGNKALIKSYQQNNPYNPELKRLRHLQARLKHSKVPTVLNSWERVISGEEHLLALELELLDQHQTGFLFFKNLLQNHFKFGSDQIFNEIQHLGWITRDLHQALAEKKSDSASFDIKKSLDQLASNFQHSKSAWIKIISGYPKLFQRQFLRYHFKNLERRLNNLCSHPLPSSSCPELNIQALHGDLHLEQILIPFKKDDKWVWIDFEGEPMDSATLIENEKPVLKDLAGMLRSFEYLISTEVMELSGHTFQINFKNLEKAGSIYQALSSEFLRYSYPAQSKDFYFILEFHLLEKQIYEINYEEEFRPNHLPLALSSYSSSSLLGIQGLSA